jgi:hypothetical protein
MIILQFEKQRCDFPNPMNNLEIKIIQEIIIFKEKIKSEDTIIKDLY